MFGASRCEREPRAELKGEEGSAPWLRGMVL